MFGKIVAVGAAVTGVLGLSAAPASAAPARVILHVPRQVVVEGIEDCTSMTITWGATGDQVAYSAAWITWPNGHTMRQWPSKLKPSDEAFYGTGCAGLRKLGKWRFKVVAYNRSGKAIASRSAYWYHKRNTSIQKFNASPEPVRKGKPITLSGRLIGLKTTSYSYTGLSGRSVRLYFLPRGSKTWSLAGTTRTTSDGRFRKAFKASRDGTWRAYYPGSTTYDIQKSTDDYVDVR